jgi:hypothetical protein
MKTYKNELDVVHLAGRGTIIVVDIPIDEELPLLNEIVLINNKLYKIRAAVEIDKSLVGLSANSRYVSLLVHEVRENVMA